MLKPAVSNPGDTAACCSSHSTRTTDLFSRLSDSGSMKYGLLEYTTDNIGDEIQSIAAQQYLPRVDRYIKRDYLNGIKSNKRIKLIMNGWFSHQPQNWPPSSDIDPLFVSFHISEKAEDSYTSTNSIEYLSKYEPIGCRDYHTRDLLLDYGIDAYFSGCLTLTLSNKYSDQCSDKVYFVDIGEDVTSMLPQSLRDQAEYLTHNYDPRPPQSEISNFLQSVPESTSRLIKAFLPNSAIRYLNNSGIGPKYYDLWEKLANKEEAPPQKRQRDKKFERAQNYLNKYAQARLVITSRLHVTLPCIAFDTPVILVHENPDDPRFGGLKEYINLYSPNELSGVLDGGISVMHNPGNITEITDDLEKSTEQFLDSP